MNKSKYYKPITMSPNATGAIKAIAELHYEMHNPYNDGWTGSHMKRRLIEIRDKATEALVNAPKYSDE
jgi:hypothetical protein